MDGDILSALAYFQEELERMSSQFNKLKELSYDLYKENEGLKKENQELNKLLFAKNKNIKGKDLDSKNNLMSLYKEGYHVCHPGFGEKREGDCMFCLKLLENQFKEQD